MPPRKGSAKLTAYGAFQGATVIRSVEDWLLGDTDGMIPLPMSVSTLHRSNQSMNLP